MALCSDPHCDRVDLPTGVDIVADVESGALYCDSLCHHAHQFGVRPPLTQEEAASLERAWTWLRKHRPEDARIARHDALRAAGEV